MTDKELIQALRHCGTPGNDCDGCVKEWECYHEMKAHPMVIAADRLEALLAENEALKTKLWPEYCQDMAEYSCPRVVQLRRENERRIQTAVSARADGGITMTCQSFGWISVEERLPECEAECIVAVKYKYDWEKDFHFDVDLADYVQEDGYIDNHWNTINDWYEGQQYMHVTHWMPLPKLPSTEGVE